MHREPVVRAALRRGLRAGHPDGRAAQDGAAPVRREGRRDRGAATRSRATRRGRPHAADRPDRARRHGDRERPDGGRPARPGHGHPQRQSSNYMVQDLCFYLRAARGPGRRRRLDHADRARPAGHRRRRRVRAVGGPDRGDVAADRGDRDRLRGRGRRVPIEFLEVELAVLGGDGPRAAAAPRSTPPRTAAPGWSTSRRGPSLLQAPLDKIHPMPFPGLNIDNVPFFAVIAAVGARAAP